MPTIDCCILPHTEPFVSVILAAHNRPELLRKSAGSVLAQSWRDLELIVVDDASGNDIATAVSALADERVRYIRRDERGGPAAARNTGLAAARGRYIAFQDDDDEWLLDKLALQAKALKGADDASMCLCGLIRLSGRVRPYPAHPWPQAIGLREIAMRPRAYTQTWLVPRTALLAEGGFDERLGLWEDWELLLRLAMRLNIRTLNQPLVLSAQSADSISHDNPGFLQAMNLILKKHNAAFAPHPRLLAGLLYVQARLLIGNGQVCAARQALRRALTLNPTKSRAWQLLAISYLGRAFVMRRFADAASLREPQA